MCGARWEYVNVSGRSGVEQAKSVGMNASMDAARVRNGSIRTLLASNVICTLISPVTGSLS